MTETPDPEEQEKHEAEPVEERVGKIEQGLDTLRGMVESIRDKIVGAPDPTPADGGEVPAGEDDPAEPVTPREQEASMKEEVKRVVAELGAEEAHAADHERLRQEAERTPVTLGRVTRKLWGDPE